MIKRIFNKIRRHTFPTVQDRWRADKGDETLRLDYPLDSESLVLDFGGYEGEWAATIHKRFGSRIVIFEAVPEYAEKIRNRFAGNNLLEVCAYGLGMTDRTEKIYMDSDGSSSFGKNGPSIDIRIADAAAWFQERGLPAVELAKLNIEGGEYELLERLIDNGITPRIKHIQIQFHTISPDSKERRKRIQDALAKTHELKWCYEFVWESWTLKGTQNL